MLILKGSLEGVHERSQKEKEEKQKQNLIHSKFLSEHILLVAFPWVISFDSSHRENGVLTNHSVIWSYTGIGDNGIDKWMSRS